MQKNIIKKGFIVAVICIFIAISFQPIIAEDTVSVEKESNCEIVNFKQVKDYLFQTLIDISNNAKLKEFLNKNKHNLITDDYNYNIAIQKILLEKPRLIKSIVFNNPEITYKYLQSTYNRGIELIKILGDVESLNIVKPAEIINPELFIELKNIILNNVELSNRIIILGEMNKCFKFEFQFGDHPIICSILEKIYEPLLYTFLFFKIKWDHAVANNKPISAIIYKFLTNLMFITVLKIDLMMMDLRC
jgi:hypothetical protein